MGILDRQRVMLFARFHRTDGKTYTARMQLCRIKSCLFLIRWTITLDVAFSLPLLQMRLLVKRFRSDLHSIKFRSISGTVLFKHLKATP